MTEITRKDVEAVLTSLVTRSDAELIALEEVDLAAQWHWEWEDGRSAEWNTYQFSQMLETHKWRCRRWEENHNGSCCVVERVRDKYVMPRVREFLAELARHNAIAQGRAEAGEARCSESPGATGYTAFGRGDE